MLKFPLSFVCGNFYFEIKGCDAEIRGGARRYAEFLEIFLCEPLRSSVYLRVIANLVIKQVANDLCCTITSEHSRHIGDGPYDRTFVI